MPTLMSCRIQHGLSVRLGSSFALVKISAAQVGVVQISAHRGGTAQIGVLQHGVPQVG